MYLMYDSVDTDQIPNGPQAVALYINGEFDNTDKAGHFPGARILAVSVTGDVPADCYDIEKGDYLIDDVPKLYSTARAAGIWRPCFYADLSNMPAVKEKLNTVVQTREDIRLWVAYYNGTPDLTDGYDAHQFTKTALDRNLDESICASTFFKPTVGTPATLVVTQGEPDYAVVTFQREKVGGHWTIKGVDKGATVE